MQPATATSSSAQPVPCSLGQDPGGASLLQHQEPSTQPLLPGTIPSELTYNTYLQLRRRHGPIPYARLLAQAFLHLALAEGPLPVGDRKAPPPNSLRAQAQAAGLSWGTIRRAATELNLRIFRTADCWYWQLPAPANPAQLTTATCAPSPSGPLPVEAAAPQGRESAPNLSGLDLAHQTCAPSPLISAA